MDEQNQMANELQQLRQQMARQMKINQKLQVDIGRITNEKANFEIGFEEMSAHARNLEKRINELEGEKPMNREENRKAEKETRLKKANESAENGKS
jgi:septal ring factor EnvC (AmiA/AmiB activator)